MKQLWTEEHFSGFEGEYYHYPAFYEPYLAIPKPYQKPYPPMLLPVDSQESFVPMGTRGYRIAIAASCPPRWRCDSPWCPWGRSSPGYQRATTWVDRASGWASAWRGSGPGRPGSGSTAPRIRRSAPPSRVAS